MVMKRWKECKECGARWESSSALRYVYGPDDRCPECDSKNVGPADGPLIWEADDDG